jgi:hypothetical protein
LFDNAVGSNQNSDPATRIGEGENVYFHFEDLTDFSTTVADAFYEEVKDYDYSDPSLSTGVVDNFTQVVWNGTCRIGCGFVGQYAVCRYGPPGN